MTSEPHSTCFERAPGSGALSDLSGCSGLGGRTVWRVMMAHLAFADLSLSVRAVRAEFGATVRGGSGWSSYFSTAGESCWLNLFDIQLVRFTDKVIYPTVRTTASTHRLCGV
eukprot:scaffold77704_cov72-Phaeocystis_antarctica.AAC.1